jgi:hypothetical protein
VERPKDPISWVQAVGVVLVGLSVLLEIVVNLVDGHWPLSSITVIAMGTLGLSALLLWHRKHRD